MVRKKTVLILVSVVLFLGMVACSGMTPKKMAASMMATYNQQYEAYKQQVAQPNLTEDQKKLLRQKRAILNEVHPLIETFDITVVQGQVPDAALQAQILNLLNQLGGGK